MLLFPSHVLHFVLSSTSLCVLVHLLLHMLAAALHLHYVDFISMTTLIILYELSYYFPRVKHKSPPPAPPTSSLLPAGCEPLPDIFSGVVAHLHGFEGEEGRRRRCERYLVAYDGDVSPHIDGSTTHVICREGSEVSHN